LSNLKAGCSFSSGEKRDTKRFPKGMAQPFFGKPEEQRRNLGSFDQFGPKNRGNSHGDSLN
jgi:peptidoglycan hydrolase-like protein with peptidoglycan-binding domain